MILIKRTLNTAAAPITNHLHWDSIARKDEDRKTRKYPSKNRIKLKLKRTPTSPPGGR